VNPSRRIYFVLAWLAVGGALALFPYLGLLGLPTLFVTAGALCAILLRLGPVPGLTRWRNVSGSALLLAGTATLILATWATPAGFLTPSGPTLLMRLGRYHRRARLSFSGAVRLLVVILAVFPVCLMLFLALSRFWPLSD
jgi:hypothetical protein